MLGCEFQFFHSKRENKQEHQQIIRHSVWQFVLGTSNKLVQNLRCALQQKSFKTDSMMTAVSALTRLYFALLTELPLKPPQLRRLVDARFEARHAGGVAVPNLSEILLF